MAEITNHIYKGANQDADPRYQPKDSYRDSKNGTITNISGNKYTWRPVKGTMQSFSIPVNEKLMGHCVIRNRLFILTLNEIDNIVKISEILFISGILGTVAQKWFGNNDLLKLSLEHPIRRMIGFYENENIQRIYFTDFHNPPRVINIGNEERIASLEEKFIEFTPEITNAYGTFTPLRLIGGGNLAAGNYFFVWRYYTPDGYYSDWSYLSNPIHVNDGVMSTSDKDIYQNLQGQAPDEKTTKAIRFKITDLDEEYPSIQIAAFYSNDYNSYQPGIIFYNGDVPGTEIFVTYRGGENAGSISLSDIVVSSIRIEKCKDIQNANNLNILANVQERRELDVSGMNTLNKNNLMEVEVQPEYYEIPLDYSHPSGDTHFPGNARIAVPESNVILKNMWYKALLSSSYLADDGTTVSYSQGDIFQAEKSGYQHTTKALRPILRIKKYRKASATTPYDDDDYVYKEISITEGPQDYKNPVIASELKGYPSDEIIRLGVLFLDKTGRPYFVRWLKNTDVTYGQGDTTTPERDVVNHKLLSSYNAVITADGTEYLQTNGNVMSLVINNLDITDIKDQIGGFMIVRAPIIRRHIAQGVLCYVSETGYNLGTYPAFYDYNSYSDKYDGGYVYYCPESLFNFKDFNIQKGDKLCNVAYYKPFNEEAVPVTNSEGLGLLENNSHTDDFKFWQKFMIAAPYGETHENSQIGSKHEILHHTEYKLNDHEVSVNPDQPLKVFYKNCMSHDLGGTIGNIRGINSNLDFLVLDIDETTDGYKGSASTAEIKTPICSIYRENDNPYGGTGDSSLTNTQYIACGHFQEINDSVLDDIKNGDNYVFNGIQIFGGDTFIQLFDLNRIVYDETIGSHSSDRFGHSVIFPVETRMNLSLREGNHYAKDLIYQSDDNPTGLRYELSSEASMKIEVFNYNDGYSSINIDDYYPALPYNHKMENTFDSRLRYSNGKSIGELEDQFCKFGANSFLDVSPISGPINNIRFKYDKLVYWQDDDVGYVPINERALISDQSNNPVQLGISGVFQRNDKIIEKIGNSNQFGLVSSDYGYHWYDAKRKIYVSLDYALKYDEKSIAEGFDNFFENEIPPVIDIYDRPIYDYGVVGGYDPENKTVYHTFRIPGEEYKTIGYDIQIGALIGTFDFPSVYYFNHKNSLFGIGGSFLRRFYIHNKTNERKYYDVTKDAYIDIIINPGEESVIYDAIEIAGDFGPDKVIFYQENLEKEELIRVYGNENYPDKRYWRYYNNRIHGSIPKIERKRIDNDYLKVRLVFSSGFYENERSFAFMKTILREAY